MLSRVRPTVRDETIHAQICVVLPSNFAMIWPALAFLPPNAQLALSISGIQKKSPPKPPALPVTTFKESGEDTPRLAYFEVFAIGVA